MIIESNFRRRWFFRTLTGMIAVCAAYPAAAWGYLFGDPISFTIASRDQQHVMVVLSSAPLADDTGNDCTLPSGERVKLRDTFPTSGLYDLATKTLIWSVNLPMSYSFENDLVRLSEDCRYVVHVNRFSTRWRTWAITFYDQGAVSKTYQISELVDFPSLLNFDGSFDIFPDESAWDAEIHDSQYSLKTSCREAYTFDVRTGGIVSEFRFWRTVSRTAIAVTAIAVILAITILGRRFIRGGKRANPAPSAAIPAPAARSLLVQFSVRTLLLFVTGIAILLASAVYWPGPTIFFAALGVATWLTISLRRSAQSSGQRWRRPALLTGVCGAWLLTYVLSFWPAIHIANTRCPWDVRMVIVQVPYAPVRWLLENTPLARWSLLEWYSRDWERSLR